jgi:uncharacterized protein (DUF4415 family)
MKQSNTLKQSDNKKSMTNWKRIRAMRDEEIDLSDSPEATPEEFARAIVKRGGVIVKNEKEQISIRLDKDMLEWFRARGKGYQREINALLRAYMEAHQK